jgi:hypothetical protein
MRDRALLLTLASLAIWIGWELLRGPHHPYGDLSNGHYTDHFSHLNAARLLPRAGLDIWRKPLTQLLRPLTHEERARLPADVKAAAYPAGEAYFVPGWPADKPMIASWSFNPRFYPPGDALLFAPVALLYHFTQLSFAGANLLALLLLLVYAHVSLYFALRATEEEPLRLFTLLIVYFPLVHWTLEGFYDAAILAPLIFCAQQLARGRGIGAILAFCCAAAMHFRAFFFAPWACAALALVLRERQWRSWGARGFAMAAAAGALAIAALVPFALLQPALRALGTSNVIALSVAPALRPQVLAFTAVAALAAAFLWRAGAILELMLLAWVMLMLFSLHQAEQWHSVVLLAWLCAPIFGHWRPAPGRDVVPMALQARLWFVLCAAAMVFHESLLPTWIARLF